VASQRNDFVGGGELKPKNAQFINPKVFAERVGSP
jgi:hypothetical protein